MIRGERHAGQTINVRDMVASGGLDSRRGKLDSFVLLYAAFWSGPYSLFQSIVIVLVSFILLAGIMGAMWAFWGMRFARMGMPP